MGRSRLDGALWARIARRGGVDPSLAGEDAQYLTVDPASGALVVTGAGAAPTATALRIADGGPGEAEVGADGALLVRDVGTSGAGVSSANSLNTPLAANAEFIGPLEPTAGFAEIAGTVITDVPSASGGLRVEFYRDNDLTTLLKTEDATVPGQGIGLHFAFQPEGSWFRVRYLNGPTAQSYVRSQVIFNVRPGQAAQLPLGASVDDTNTAALSRASLLARHSSGAHLPLSTAGDGRLDVQTGLAQPLTDAQLAARGLATDAALVPLLDGIEALLTAIRDRNLLTDAQLRATPVPVSTMRNPDVITAGTVQAVGSAVTLVTAGSVSSFSFDITGFTTGTFVIERTLAPDPTAAGALWTVVGAFKAGTRTSKGSWTDSPGAYHGNASASSAVRIRVTSALNAPATVNLLASSGTGTITIGAIASNEGNVIGAVADLEQHYASTEGGYLLFNSTSGPLSIGASAVRAFLFENPTGSGRDVRLYRITTASTQPCVWERFRNPTISSRGAAQPNVNRGGGSPTSQAALRNPDNFTVTANGTTGETHTTAAGGTDRDLVAGGIRLKPGEAVLFRCTNNSTLNASISSLHLVWTDLPAVA